MLRVTCVDGVAVARGAIGNPWIFEQTRALLAGRPKPAPPDVAEQGRVMRMHFDLAEQLHGPERCGRLMRKFGIQYAALHPEHVQVREALVRVKNRDDWNRVLAQWYR